MKKTKIAALIAMAGIALTFTACGTNHKPEETTEAKTETSSETTQATSATTVAKKMTSEFTVGEIGESSYKNTFFDVAFDAPDGWLVANKDQLAQISHLTSDNISDSAVKEALESGQTRTLFFAQESSGNNNLNLVSSKSANGTEVGANEIVDNLVPQLKPMYESQGYSDLTITKESVKFTGTDTPAIKIVGKYNGKDIYQTQVVIVNGSYQGILTATSFGNDGNQGLLDLIKSAN